MITGTVTLARGRVQLRRIESATAMRMGEASSSGSGRGPG